ncbi:hypothetical protein [Sphingomonas panacisoli]|uniref:hypothetical protein n=1 Tax=Sphingomonas panacisoli TaxID=1813879 RepID=UPI001F005A88|nr:hypothetical protein [Sphingomonas panacisoli]
MTNMACPSPRGEVANIGAVQASALKSASARGSSVSASNVEGASIDEAEATVVIVKSFSDHAVERRVAVEGPAVRGILI